MYRRSTVRSLAYALSMPVGVYARDRTRVITESQWHSLSAPRAHPRDAAPRDAGGAACSICDVSRAAAPLALPILCSSGVAILRDSRESAGLASPQLAWLRGARTANIPRGEPADGQSLRAGSLSSSHASGMPHFSASARKSIAPRPSQYCAYSRSNTPSPGPKGRRQILAAALSHSASP